MRSLKTGQLPLRKGRSKGRLIRIFTKDFKVIPLIEKENDGVVQEHNEHPHDLLYKNLIEAIESKNPKTIREAFDYILEVRKALEEK